MNLSLRVGWTLVILIGLPRAIFSVERPRIQVKFAIEEPVYTEQLADQEETRLESNIEKFILDKLNDEIPFFRYDAGPSSIILKISLGRANASEERSHDVYFHLSLFDQRMTHSAVWEFRPRINWNTTINSEAAFRREIEDSLKRKRFTDLVQGFFEHIPVASEGESIQLPDYPGYPMVWVLPFKQIDLCMAQQSRVRIATEIETSFNPREPKDFRAETTVYARARKREHQDRILCLPEKEQDFTLLMNCLPENVKVRQVFVVSYLKMLTGCRPPVPPREVVRSLRGS